MTDNEKRAHDLAVMSTYNLMQMKLEDHEKNSKNHPESYEDFKFDTYAEYVKIYKAFLNRVSEDFTSSN